jgi:hypothetical protein
MLVNKIEIICEGAKRGSKTALAVRSLDTRKVAHAIKRTDLIITEF